MKLIINVKIEYVYNDANESVFTRNDTYRYEGDTITTLPSNMHRMQLERSFKSLHEMKVSIVSITWDKDSIFEYIDLDKKYYCRYYQLPMKNTDKCKQCDIHCLQNTNIKPNHLHEKS